MMNKRRVLLLDADFVQAYSVAKSLRKTGCYVLVTASTRMCYGFFSRYPHKRFLSPSSSQHDIYRGFVIEAIDKYKVDVLVPLTNDTAEILSEYYFDFESKGVKVAEMPWDIFIKAHDKESLMAICEKENIPHPRTRPLKLDKIDSIAGYVGFPAMIKPNVSVGARGIIKVNNLCELKQKAESSLEQFGACSLQQFIDNDERYYNVILYRNRVGEVLAHTVLEITRFFPIQGGSSCYCTTIENDILVNLCSRVLDLLNWVGVADFDILFDKKEGFKIIEINPRVPASVHAAYKAGVNFPAIIVKDLIGEEQIRSDYRPGNHLRFFFMDCMWFVFSPNRFKSKPSWFKFIGRRLNYQDLSITDPLIFFAGFLNGLSKLFNPQYRRAKLKNQ